MARRIRREEGASINEIARRTGAAKSSISRWVRDIELTDEQRDLLRIAAYNGNVKGRTMHVQFRREARVMAQEEGRMRARLGDGFFTAGCMLDWAEGSKDRNHVEFTNSDAQMVGFFVRFLKTYWSLSDEEIRITCNLFADHVDRQHEIEQFWLDIADLPRESLRKSTVNRYSKYSKKKRRNRLPYGTCRVTVCRTRVVRASSEAFRRSAVLDATPGWNREVAPMAESEQQGRNRELIELLNELRIALPGVQVLFAFLLAVPFAKGFPRLSETGRDVFFAAFIATALSTVVLIAPSSYHRLRWRQNDKERMLVISNALTIAGLACLAVAISCAVYVITDFLFHRTWAAAFTALVGAAFLILWYGLPLASATADPRRESRPAR